MPVLTKEMRSRMRGARMLVLLFTCTALAVVVAILLLGFMRPADISKWGGAAVVGLALFAWLAALEGVLIALITPALTAGSITLEREQGTLEALLFTPLSTRSILLGKLLSAVGTAGIILLCVLPVMAVSFILGGISPMQVAYTLALLLSMVLFFSTVGLYCSVCFRQTVTSVMLSYLICLFWLLAIPLLQLVQQWMIEYKNDMKYLLIITFMIGLALLAIIIIIAFHTKIIERDFSRIFKVILWSCWAGIGVAYVIFPYDYRGDFWLLQLGNPGAALWQLLFSPSSPWRPSVSDHIYYGPPDEYISPGWLVDYFVPITVAILLIVSLILFLLAERQFQFERDCRMTAAVRQ